MKKEIEIEIEIEMAELSSSNTIDLKVFLNILKFTGVNIINISKV